MTMFHGDFCLVGCLLAFKRRENLDCLIAAMKFTHVVFQTEALVRCAGLSLVINNFQFQEIKRTNFHTGATAHAFLLINLNPNLNDFIFRYFWHLFILLKNLTTEDTEK